MQRLHVLSAAQEQLQSEKCKIQQQSLVTSSTNQIQESGIGSKHSSFPFLSARKVWELNAKHALSCVEIRAAFNRVEIFGMLSNIIFDQVSTTYNRVSDLSYHRDFGVVYCDDYRLFVSNVVNRHSEPRSSSGTNGMFNSIPGFFDKYIHKVLWHPSRDKPIVIATVSGNGAHPHQIDLINLSDPKNLRMHKIFESTRSENISIIRRKEIFDLAWQASTLHSCGAAGLSSHCLTTGVTSCLISTAALATPHFFHLSSSPAVCLAVAEAAPSLLYVGARNGCIYMVDTRVDGRRSSSYG